MRSWILFLVLLGALLSGCADGGGDPDGRNGTDGPFNGTPDDALEDAWVAARFDDGIEHVPLWLNGTLPQGEASGCNIRFDDQDVCVGEEDRLDLTPFVTHGHAYAFNASLTASPPDMVGATNIGFREDEPWGEAEWDRSNGQEAVSGRFVRFTDGPLYLAVYHLLPAEQDITYSLRVDLQLLQQPVAASVPLALDVDPSVTEVAVPLTDDGAVRVWDGADTYLGRFVGNETVTGPDGEPVPAARINVSGADRSAALVLQVMGAGGGAPALVRGAGAVEPPPLRFLATQETFTPHTSLAGPVEASWEFTPDVVPLRVGVYMGAPDDLEPWSAEGVHMRLTGPGGDDLVEISSGCTFCGGGTVAAWSSWGDGRVQEGTYAVTVDAADPQPQAVGAGGEVGHVVVAFVR